MPSCHLSVSDVNQGNKDFWRKKVGSRFSCVTPETERFSLDLPRATKKNMTSKWGSGRCVEFVVTG